MELVRFSTTCRPLVALNPLKWGSSGGGWERGCRQKGAVSEVRNIPGLPQLVRGWGGHKRTKVDMNNENIDTFEEYIP